MNTSQEECEHVFAKDEDGKICKRCGLRAVDARDLAVKKTREASIGMNDQVLILIYLLPEHVASTDTKLMKEVFLVEREGPKLFRALPPAGFIPDKYGPCSAFVYHALKMLSETGYIRRKQGAISGSTETLLTAEGMKKAEGLLKSVDDEKVTKMKKFLQDLDSFDQKALLRYVYTRYPAYISKSTIKAEILKGGEGCVQKSDRSR